MVRSIEKLMGQKLERRTVEGYTVRLPDPRPEPAANKPHKQGRMSHPNQKNHYRSRAKQKS
jgi:hypothetical protein